MCILCYRNAYIEAVKNWTTIYTTSGFNRSLRKSSAIRSFDRTIKLLIDVFPFMMHYKHVIHNNCRIAKLRRDELSDGMFDFLTDRENVLRLIFQNYPVCCGLSSYYSEKGKIFNLSFACIIADPCTLVRCFKILRRMWPGSASSWEMTSLTWSNITSWPHTVNRVCEFISPLISVELGMHVRCCT